MMPAGDDAELRPEDERAVCEAGGCRSTREVGQQHTTGHVAEKLNWR